MAGAISFSFEWHTVQMGPPMRLTDLNEPTPYSPVSLHPWEVDTTCCHGMQGIQKQNDICLSTNIKVCHCLNVTLM